MIRWLPRLVARLPLRVHGKLLFAFLAIVGLLIAVGAVGLQVLSGVNRRAEDMVKLQRKIAAYRQLQHDTTSQLYGVSSALLVPDDRTLEATLRQLNQFGYDLDRLAFVAQDEVELFGRVREDYEEFIKIVTQVIELIRAGQGPAGRELQLSRAGPLADRLERLTNELVNKAEADMVAGIEASQDAYVKSQRVVVELRGWKHLACAGPRLRHLVVPHRAGASRWTSGSARSQGATSPSAWRSRTGTSWARWRGT